MAPVDMDLNLLVALDALLEEGSVGAAADRLGLSQPAMSRTLGRIRRATGDQILVRSGRSMLPTPYAEQVRGEVRAVVEQARGLLRPARRVDPAILERTFTLRCNDAVTDAAGPAIVAAARAVAPGVRLRLLAEAATDTEDLRQGRVDLEIHADAAGSERPDLRSETVGHGTLAVVLRSGHPVRELTLEAYAACEHVLVSRRGRLRDRVDERLEAHGLARDVVVCVPSSAAAFRLAARSDLLVAVPAVLTTGDAGDELGPAGLRAAALPPELAPDPAEVAMTWHRRYDGDGGHAWLRTLVREVLAAAFSDASE
jgi:DNA-binding transcriptional LysR family regulator